MVQFFQLQSTSLIPMPNGLFFQGSIVFSLQLIGSPKLLICISCMQAPVYVNKQIVLTDAIRISYGMGRVRDTKSTYDVSLDRYIAYTAFGVFSPICLAYSNCKHGYIFPVLQMVEIY